MEHQYVTLEEFIADDDAEFGGEMFQDIEGLKSFAEEMFCFGVKEITVELDEGESSGAMFLQVSEQMPVSFTVAVANNHPDECERQVAEDGESWIRLWWD